MVRGTSKGSEDAHDPARAHEASRTFHASLLQAGLQLVDSGKADATKVGLLNAVVTLVEAAHPTLVTAEIRARHEFIMGMWGVQCMLEPGGAWEQLCASLEESCVHS